MAPTRFAAMNLTLDGGGPILCFGGPYSNLQATEAVRREAARLGIPPQRTICTGDVVAYCAHPNETARLIRDWGCHVIKGNCEENLAARADDCGCGFADGSACNLLSRRWYAYADRLIEDDLRTWMSDLPAYLTFTLAGRTGRVIHGGVTETSRFLFASSPARDKASELSAAGTDLVIAGHCGIPFIEKLDGGVWFNPGVIGMPGNDGTPDGWYGLITPQADGAIEVSLHRLAYDWAAAAAALDAAGSAPAYAEALRSGLWPSLDVLPAGERRSTGRPLAETRVAWPGTDCGAHALVNTASGHNFVSGQSGTGRS